MEYLILKDGRPLRSTERDFTTIVFGCNLQWCQELRSPTCHASTLWRIRLPMWSRLEEDEICGGKRPQDSSDGGGVRSDGFQGRHIGRRVGRVYSP